MSIILYAEASNGLLTAVSQGWRVGELELQLNAAEAAVGTSQIVIDDPDSTFYMRGLKPLYVVETEATGDAYLGIIGVFWSWNRVFRRSPDHPATGREVVIHAQDLNTLLTYRVQKGADAQRDAETDVERIEWLINTAEVIGGHGDHGFSIEDTTYFDHVGPVNMSESDYTGQDSAGVINDALQDSGKNAFLLNKPTSVTAPIRVGIWYAHSSSSNFSSLHKISNVLADISAPTIDHFATVVPSYSSNYTFAPSIDAELDRDPSRQITGAMVQYDGGYVYTSNPITYPTLTRRDMVFEGGLVKTANQALARATRYVNDLDEEDDAITCAVIVPGKLVNGFHQGERVQVKFSHLPGYESEYVWMRIASRTVRQIPEGAGISNAYEIAMDLRAESPPGPPIPAAPGPLPCPDDTPGLESQGFPPLGAHVPPNGNAGDTPEPGVIQYSRAGLTLINAPSTTHINSWHFPVYGSGGAGTRDYCGANLGNGMRFVMTSAGTITVNAFGSHGTSFEWKLIHLDGFTEITEQSGTIGIDGSMIPVDVPADEHCYHTLILEHFTAVGPGRFNFDGAAWNPVLG